MYQHMTHREMRDVQQYILSQKHMVVPCVHFGEPRSCHANAKLYCETNKGWNVVSGWVLHDGETAMLHSVVFNVGTGEFLDVTLSSQFSEIKLVPDARLKMVEQWGALELALGDKLMPPSVSLNVDYTAPPKTLRL
ncbi:hypothetical protein A6A04_04640 [Paramagnetospirillum marisnigri]|uniref:Uncharacterized protein n=1 Tax=Paramagnetospirillum marisnigri TaxID=1285242 RepID=A0A178MH84_9PROT|nr:hypothetical protein [Paramagnetospirillum marisnigri]OAN48050.1 hypothetical protein A6A04_04640 [Paramagnetospirillum marisnigri]